MQRQPLFGVLMVFVAVADASAHNSRAVFHDSSRVIETEGVVTRVLWRNPHTRFWLMDDNGVEWALESTPPATLSRHGLGRAVLTEGARIRVAGPAARFAANAMEVHNVLLPDGKELLIQVTARPRWTEDVQGLEVSGFAESDVRAAEAAATGMFRVWSRPYGESFSLVPDNGYPLSAAALAATEAYDPVADNPIPGRTPKGMPMIMSNPLPLEFVNAGDEIRLRIEEYDLVRVIQMDPDAEEVSPSSLGYSVGHWENGDLVVTTTNVNFMHFGSQIPLSADVELLERFAPSADQQRLDYTLTVTDALTFAPPLVVRRHWVWVPGETVEPWLCEDDNE